MKSRHVATPVADNPLLGVDAERQGRLEALLAEVDAPGAVFGVMRGSDVSVHAAGVANLDTGLPMTPSTLFLVASVSKLYTATLAMQLVDEGLLDLERPIQDYLPGFRVTDPHATERLTSWHLLTHTSGLDGDKFDSFGQGDDALERYVADCATLGQVHELGATYSYCNSGMIIMGRVVEVLRGTTFDAVLQTHLLDPLGLTLSGMSPADLIWRPLAAGHRRADDHVGVFQHWENDRAHRPAGGVVTNAAELLAFVRMHLDGGVARDGKRVLSVDSATRMRTPQVALPDAYEETTHLGLGWELSRRPGQPELAGHGGDLLAHHARMVSCPQADLTLVLLVNGDGADHIADPLFRAALAEVGASLAAQLSPPTAPAQVDVSAVAGTYETAAVRISLAAAGDHLEATVTITSERIAEMLPEDQREHRGRLVPVDETLYLIQHGEGDPWDPVVFYEADGRAYLHTGARAFPSTSVR